MRALRAGRAAGAAQALAERSIGLGAQRPRAAPSPSARTPRARTGPALPRAAGTSRSPGSPTRAARRSAASCRRAARGAGAPRRTARRPCSRAPPGPRRRRSLRSARAPARAARTGTGAAPRPARSPRPRSPSPRALRAACSRPCRCRAARGGSSPGCGPPAPNAGSSITSRNSPLVSSSACRHALGVPQQALRRHHHEGLAEVAADLAAQRVEVLRGRRQVRDLQVVLGAELQEALEPRARVLGALALVAVRQEHDQTRRAAPLLLAARDELVDDDLRAVREVAELRLPQREPVRVDRAVAVLEAEHRGFRQERVRDREARAAGAELVERDEASSRSRRRAAPPGGGRRCRARRPDPSCARECPRRAASRTRAPRPCPSRSARWRTPSARAARACAAAWGARGSRRASRPGPSRPSRARRARPPSCRRAAPGFASPSHRPW